MCPESSRTQLSASQQFTRVRPGKDFARRWLLRAVAFIPGYALAAYLANWTVLFNIRAEAALLFAITLVRPAIGLTAVALLAPLGDVLVPILGASPFRHAETLVVAFLAGWLANFAAADRRISTMSRSLASAMWFLGIVIVASVAANAVQLHRENPEVFSRVLFELRELYLMTDDPIGAHAAGALLEGMGLIAATAIISRRELGHRGVLLLALLTSAVAASVASLLLAYGQAPTLTLARQAAVGLPRYAATNHDVNAVGSYYVLLLGIAIGFAVSGGRAWAAWVIAAGLLLEGLVLTGSRAALACAALLVFSITGRWLLRARSRKARLIVAIAITSVVVGLLPLVASTGAMTSLGMRGDFNRSSLLMISARPLLGVGIGRYFWLSRLTLPPSLAWVYGLENAHDYYLQMTAELGLVGLVGFGWLLAAALRTPLASVLKGTADTATMACVSGALAYLTTAFSGHPFLVAETAIPFWLVMGIVTNSTTRTAAPSRWPRDAAIAGGCALLLTAPFRAGAPAIHPRASDDGFRATATDESGRVFREAEPFASLFIGPSVTAVEIPMRSTGAPMTVGLKVPRESSTTALVGSDWTVVTIPLQGADLLVPLQRINLAVVPPAGTGAGQVVPRLEVGTLDIVQAK